ncbi:calcium-binding tyrosine phosphorylation-regulated protein isoform X3 [Callorhinchus milii]|uniref:calcium-binding tyrosine phosphorylation-regulated protein isoform X3 n=1 Tax=Callorhinchus milii TaxID=7868 RepID=UPI001C3F7472|nr:calcium-binding tyrosine phosphorylation-regulated protein isoform X3 [Callorhinchus milii]
MMDCSTPVVPYGFRVLLETLGKTVLHEQPVDVHQFASGYFKELLQFRDVHPTLDVIELANLFYLTKAILKSIKTQDDLNVNSILSEDGITVSQQASGSAIEQSQSLISCNLSQSSGHQLDLNLDSELTSTQHQTEQESPVIDDDFEKVHLRLDELGSKMQGLMHNVRILITTVKEIHSAMNINAQ